MDHNQYISKNMRKYQVFFLLEKYLITLLGIEIRQFENIFIFQIKEREKVNDGYDNNDMIESSTTNRGVCYTTVL